MLGSVLFMLAGFGLLVLHSYRRARQNAERGQPFQPTGKLRWPESR